MDSSSSNPPGMLVARDCERECVLDAGGPMCGPTLNDIVLMLIALAAGYLATEWARSAAYSESHECSGCWLWLLATGCLLLMLASGCWLLYGVRSQDLSLTVFFSERDQRATHCTSTRVFSDSNDH